MMIETERLILRPFQVGDAEDRKVESCIKTKIPSSMRF